MKSTKKLWLKIPNFNLKPQSAGRPPSVTARVTFGCPCECQGSGSSSGKEGLEEAALQHYLPLIVSDARQESTSNPQRNKQAWHLARFPQLLPKAFPDGILDA